MDPKKSLANTVIAALLAWILEPEDQMELDGAHTANLEAAEERIEQLKGWHRDALTVIHQKEDRIEDILTNLDLMFRKKNAQIQTLQENLDHAQKVSAARAARILELEEYQRQTMDGCKEHQREIAGKLADRDDEIAELQDEVDENLLSEADRLRRERDAASEEMVATVERTDRMMQDLEREIAGLVRERDESEQKRALILLEREKLIRRAEAAEARVRELESQIADEHTPGHYCRDCQFYARKHIGGPRTYGHCRNTSNELQPVHANELACSEFKARAAQGDTDADRRNKEHFGVGLKKKRGE